MYVYVNAENYLFINNGTKYDLVREIGDNVDVEDIDGVTAYGKIIKLSEESIEVSDESTDEIIYIQIDKISTIS